MVYGIWPIIVSLVMACWVLFLGVTTLSDLNHMNYAEIKNYKRHRSLLYFLIFSQAVAICWIIIRITVRMGLL